MLDGNGQQNNANPDAESKKFLEEIWDKEVTHNEKAEWINTINSHTRNVPVQAEITITGENIQKQLKKMVKWKASGPDNAHGYWLRGFSSLHDTITVQLDDYLRTGEVPLWMTKGRTCLIQKDASKGNIVTNYRPITCLPLMWKLLTRILGDEIYQHLEERNLFPDEQKGCRRNRRGQKIN